MSYYSTVKIRCQKEDLHYFEEAFEKCKQPDSCEEPLYPDKFMFNPKDNTYIMCWNWKQWFEPSDENVQAIMEVVRNLSEDEDKDFDYVRIGENLEDADIDEFHSNADSYDGLYPYICILGDEDAVETTAPWDKPKE